MRARFLPAALICLVTLASSSPALAGPPDCCHPDATAMASFQGAGAWPGPAGITLNGADVTSQVLCYEWTQPGIELHFQSSGIQTWDNDVCVWQGSIVSTFPDVVTWGWTGTTNPHVGIFTPPAPAAPGDSVAHVVKIFANDRGLCGADDGVRDAQVVVKVERRKAEWACESEDSGPIEGPRIGGYYHNKHYFAYSDVCGSTAAGRFGSEGLERTIELTYFAADGHPLLTSRRIEPPYASGSPISFFEAHPPGSSCDLWGILDHYHLSQADPPEELDQGLLDARVTFPVSVELTSRYVQSIFIDGSLSAFGSGLLCAGPIEWQLTVTYKVRVGQAGEPAIVVYDVRGWMQ